ncbi:hypothetical protein [Cloacibacillus sp. An23]|uniref:hypothetical protein n=1 Tax=Cloacibacillus sp. An23 TaxID=1965591 RepID=UPI000B388BB3|nr:hypothetical protein [Cloacibacillus sp. An23]OUO94807.1 hypothetical protein B5F39_02765 [Cloacibacillus sp. An23]
MTIDELVISLGLDPRGVKDGMNKAEGMIQSGLSKIGNLVKNIAAPIAGAFAASELFNSYVNGATALDRLSQSLGMDIERLQEWQGAARTAGVEAEEVGNIFRDMNDYITDATRFDSGPLKEIAAQLGISLTDVNGAARNSEAVLLDLADAFQTVGAQEATGYGMQLSFDPGMIALLQQGRDALEELFREQRELGVYTKRDAEIAKTFNRELGDLWQSMKAGSAVILRMIVPAMTKMVDWIDKAVKFMRQHEDSVEIFFKMFAAAITAVALPALARLAKATLTNPFTLLIAGAVALALALEDLFGWMNGKEAAFGDFWSKFGTPEEVKASVENFIATLKNILPTVLSVGKVIATLVAGLWTLRGAFGAVKLIGGVMSPLIKVFTLVGNVGGAVIAVLKLLGLQLVKVAAVIISTVIPAVVSFTAALLANPITWVVAAIMALIGALYLLYKNWDTVKEGAQALWDGLVSIFSGAVDWFKGIFDGIVDAIAGPFMTAFEKVKSGWNAVKGFFGFDEAAGTTGGLNHIGPLGGGAGQAISPARVAAGGNSYTSDTSVNIGKIEVQTQATDAEGISRDIGKGLQKNVAKFTVNQVNAGVVQ